jgi:hypothetical protein
LRNARSSSSASARAAVGHSLLESARASDRAAKILPAPGSRCGIRDGVAAQVRPWFRRSRTRAGGATNVHGSSPARLRGEQRIRRGTQPRPGAPPCAYDRSKPADGWSAQCLRDVDEGAPSRPPPDSPVVLETGRTDSVKVPRSRSPFSTADARPRGSASSTIVVSVSRERLEVKPKQSARMHRVVVGDETQRTSACWRGVRGSAGTS